jgi:hypothetical protein
MEYNELMDEVEKIFKKVLVKNIQKQSQEEDNVYQLRIMLIYEKIMLLGFNSGNIDKALEYLEHRNRKKVKPGKEIHDDLVEALTTYKIYVEKFSQVYFGYKNGIAPEILIKNLRKAFSN